MEHNYGGAPNQAILILSKDFKIKYSGALLLAGYVITNCGHRGNVVTIVMPPVACV
jgi:hypothetical protein